MWYVYNDFGWTIAGPMSEDEANSLAALRDDHHADTGPPWLCTNPACPKAGKCGGICVDEW